MNPSNLAPPTEWHLYMYYWRTATPQRVPDLRSYLPPYLPCLTDMLGVAARGAVESTRRFVVEYAREWQPADERSAARLSEALGRLSASINSHDVTLLEKLGGRCSLLKGTAPRWPFLAAPAWEECLATRTLRIPRGAADPGRSCRSCHRSSAMRRLLLPLRPLPVLQPGERAAAARAAGARLLAPRERPAPRRA